MASGSSPSPVDMPQIWDVETGKPLTKRKMLGGIPTSVARSVEFSPDGKRIVTTSMDNTAQIWDAETGERMKKPIKPGGQLLSAQFSPDGKRILTASKDGTARVWNAKTGKPLTEPMNAGLELVSAEFQSRRQAFRYGPSRFCAGLGCANRQATDGID